MKILSIILLFCANIYAGSYTTYFNLYKPAVGDTDYVTPFATGMDTIDNQLYQIYVDTTNIETNKLENTDDIFNGQLYISSQTGAVSSYDYRRVLILKKITDGGGGVSLDFNMNWVGSGEWTLGRIICWQGNNVGSGPAGYTGQLSFQVSTGTGSGQYTTVEAMRISKNKYIGIGVGDPAYLLHISSGMIHNDGSGAGIETTGDITGNSFYGDGTNLDNVVQNTETSSVTFQNSEFSVGGSTLVVSGGNVGIGTTSPAEKLDVIGRGKFNGTVQVTAGVSPSGGQGLELLNSTSDDTGIIQAYDRDNLLWNPLTLKGSSITWRISDVEKMRLDENGNLGIGTIAPTKKLHIVGESATTSNGYYGGKVFVSTNNFSLTGYGNNGDNLVVYDSDYAGITIANDTNGIGRIFFADETTGANTYMGEVRYNHSDDHMALFTAAGERMRIDSSGNVGIGTTAPNAKLEVNGGVRLNTTSTKPTCDSSTRGELWFSQGGSGVADTLEICAKDATDTYAWRTLY